MRGGTLRNLSSALQPLGRGPDAVAAAEAAVTVLELLGPTVELAWAYSSLARARMLNAEHQAAIDLAVRAQAIAEPLGALDVLSHALNTQGCSVKRMGGEWTSYLHKALDIALSAGLDDQAGQAFKNLHGSYVDQRRFAEAERYFIDGVAYCDDHDISSHRPSCGECRREPWSRPGAGMRRWRSVTHCWPVPTLRYTASARWRCSG
jgi:tetratricopeptide (TPR) repeat protein